MKNRYISSEQMEIYLQKGRRERSLALATMINSLVFLLKKYFSKHSANLPKATVCEQII
jgi:hypothetical protein